MNLFYQWPADSLKISKAPKCWMISLHSLKCLLAVEPIILWSCLIRIKDMRKPYHFGEAVFKKLKSTVPFVFESTDPKGVVSATWQVSNMIGCSIQNRLLFLPAKILFRSLANSMFCQQTLKFLDSNLNEKSQILHSLPERPLWQWLQIIIGIFQNVLLR